MANLIEQTNHLILTSTSQQFHQNVFKDLVLNKIGRLLHTVQDFYSHTNWIEMGFDRINKNIGSKYNQLGVPLAEKNASTCFSQNCTKQVIMCKHLRSLSVFSESLIGVQITCPIVYYKCKNDVIKDKLTSGYFSNQKFDDGSEVVKPNEGKCNHGGWLDKINGELQVVGGINKDTAFYLLSPHAHLHKKAAQLAAQHTQHYFDMLRAKIGNDRFDHLFGILHRPNSFFDCLFKKFFFFG